MTRLTASSSTDAAVRRRLGWIWGLLFMNVLTFQPAPLILPIPSVLGKLVTQGSLVVALVLTLMLNRRHLMRPNGFLVLFSVLCGISLLMSLHGFFGFGSVVRSVRLVVFVLILWLLTPWWGRRDLFFARIHRRALLIVMGSVLLGMAVSPGKAFAQAGGGRLGGALWPIAPTQVAHYAAVFTGLTVVMWFTGQIRPRSAVVATVAGVAILLLTHTRTAVVALLLGIIVAGVSLFVSYKRVRKAFIVAPLVVLLGLFSFAPFVNHWFDRGESAQELSQLTGRTQVWSAVVHQPRGEVNTLFGYGMSNDSYNGLPIDSSWLSIYQDQGLVGDAIVAVALILLLLIALMAPRGPSRAMALFLVVYCMIASYTETGLGGASPYLLDLTVTMSLVMPSLVRTSGGRRSSDPVPTMFE
jgi:O-antigen ligase